MNKRNILIYILCAVLVITGVVPVTVEAAVYSVKINRTVSVDDSNTYEIKTLDYYYGNNILVSLRDVAAALKGTNKAFNVDFSEGIAITSGGEYEGSVTPWSEEERNTSFRTDTVRRIFAVDEVLRTYHGAALEVSKNGGDSSGESENSEDSESSESEKSDTKKSADNETETDIFVKPIDIAMMLDVSMNMEDGVLKVDTTKAFNMSPDDLEAEGYCRSLNTLLVGDATTGEIFYGYQSDTPFFIASTTKLMTYYVVMDAVKAGKISLEDEFTVTKNGEELSKGNDAVVSLTAGQKISVQELLCGMLIPSSNECALTLAEGVAGSEAEFVKLMNEKAEELSLENSTFYNCNGLPYYNNDFAPAKIQNSMTGEDMFNMVSALLKDHPEITGITSVREMTLPTIQKEIKNSNHLLYNVDGVCGLKTGTTNKSGTCLVSAATVNKDGEMHYVVTVMLGEEGDEDRVRASEVAMRYGIREVLGSTEDYEGAAKSVPSDPERVMKRLILKAMK